MAQGNRSKEVWIIPKRGSLHQTVYLLNAIVDREYQDTTWNPQKQNNIGNDLRKAGATRFGRTISNQSVRTLAASIPQYLGFLFIDTTTTPNIMRITPSGYKLLEAHKNEIKQTKNLYEAKEGGYLIEESTIYLEQFEKLQITNPIELSHCENIFVFPFRLTLKLLLELSYLDREELAFFVFRMRDESEFDLTVEQIRRFRQQSYDDRVVLIEEFKKTHIGNITLVQAPSAGYYERLCEQTGIIRKSSILVPNPGNNLAKKLPIIEIKAHYKEYAKQVCDVKYRGANVYDFGENLQLWIDYIGNPNRLFPPIDIYLHNSGTIKMIILIKQNGRVINGDLVMPKSTVSCPAFLNETYEVEYIDPQTGAIIETSMIMPTLSQANFEFANSKEGITIVDEKAEEIAEQILDHSSSRTFNHQFLSYLKVLTKITGEDFINDKGLRGGQYEYLFFKLLDKLKEDGVIDDVVWNSRLGKYGLPRPAPGGKTGIPDIVFEIDDQVFVLEVTTIKAKSTQFSAEGSSVPDHIKLFAAENTCRPIGIFCAPKIHERNTNAMKAVLEPYGIKIICITDNDLIDILLTKNRQYILDSLLVHSD